MAFPCDAPCSRHPAPGGAVSSCGFSLGGAVMRPCAPLRSRGALLLRRCAMAVAFRFVKTSRFPATPSAPEASVRFAWRMNCVSARRPLLQRRPAPGGAALRLWLFTWWGRHAPLRPPPLQRFPAPAVLCYGCGFSLCENIVFPCDALSSRGVLPQWCCATTMAVRLVETSRFCTTLSAPEASGVDTGASLSTLTPALPRPPAHFRAPLGFLWPSFGLPLVVLDPGVFLRPGIWGKIVSSDWAGAPIRSYLGLFCA